MTRKVRLAFVLLLPASACGSGGPAAPNNRPAAVNQTRAPGNGAAEPAAPKDAAPDLSGLSPSQRRAYDQGYRDCSVGRYDPDRYPEAYRIGCGAAHDRQPGARPQG